MKIIDMLDRIAKGEESLLIKYRDKILHWNKEKDRFEDKDSMNTLYEMDFSELNEEVEIIEEDKKIEKLELVSNGNPNSYALLNEYGTKCGLTKHSKIMCDKINEIIDYINGGTNGE